MISIPVFCCNSFNACRCLHDRLCFGFVICISASCDLTSVEGYWWLNHWVPVRFTLERVLSLFLQNRTRESHKILMTELQVSFCPLKGAKIGIVNFHMMLTKLPLRVLDKFSKGEEKSCIFLVANEPLLWIDEVKTLIDNTPSQCCLFLDSSSVFFNLTHIFFSTRRAFFSTQISKFDSCLKSWHLPSIFFIHEHIFCKSWLIFFKLYSMYFTSFNLCIMFSTCFTIGTTLQVKVFAWLPFGNQLFWFRETVLQIKSPAPKF